MLQEQLRCVFFGCHTKSAQCHLCMNFAILSLNCHNGHPASGLLAGVLKRVLPVYHLFSYHKSLSKNTLVLPTVVITLFTVLVPELLRLLLHV